MKINSKELNKLKLRSSRMKLINSDMDMIQGQLQQSLSSKNSPLFSPFFSSFFLENTITGIYGSDKFFSFLPNEDNDYPYTSGWKYLSTGNSVAVAVDTTKFGGLYSNGFMLYRYDSINKYISFSAAEKTESFDGFFQSNFGVNYRTYTQKNGDIFMMLKENGGPL